MEVKAHARLPGSYMEWNCQKSRWRGVYASVQMARGVRCKLDIAIVNEGFKHVYISNRRCTRSTGRNHGDIRSSNTNATVSTRQLGTECRAQLVSASRLRGCAAGYRGRREVGHCFVP